MSSHSLNSNQKWNEWNRKLLELLDRVGKCRFPSNNFKLLNQIFQAYVYTLIAYYIAEYSDPKNNIVINIRPVGIKNNSFYYKLNPRAYYFSGKTSKYSYFVFDIVFNSNVTHQKKAEYSLMLNIDTTIDYFTKNVLNLDIAIIEEEPSNRVPRDKVVVFIECKSINHASTEYLALVLGQRYLVKIRGIRKIGHPYFEIPDLLAVRGNISETIRNFCEKHMKGKVRIIGDLNPAVTSGEKELKGYVNLILNKLINQK